eukprot:9371028-Lingulodinium_polyedra.AAC.1
MIATLCRVTPTFMQCPPWDPAGSTSVGGAEHVSASFLVIGFYRLLGLSRAPKEALTDNARGVHRQWTDSGPT